MKVFIEMNQKSEGHFLNKLHVFFKDFYVHKSDVEKYWGWSVFYYTKIGHLWKILQNMFENIFCKIFHKCPILV